MLGYMILNIVQKSCKPDLYLKEAMNKTEDCNLQREQISSKRQDAERL